MDARVRLTPETANQKSTKTKILEWMAQNPLRCRNTNAAVLARYFTETIPFNSARTEINNMVAKQMLHRDGGRRKATFTINYLHPQMPKSVLEAAPKETQERIKDTLSKIDASKHIDENGCIVSESTKSKVLNLLKQESNTIIRPTQAKKIEVKQIKETNVSSDMSEEKPVAEPITIKSNVDGLSISITLNINLNNTK